MSTDRDDLAELLGSLLVSQQQNQNWYVSRSSGDTLCLDGWFDPRALAASVLDAGLRPPARRIETVEELAAEATGTVFRSRHGDVGSIDHGGNGEWTGMNTRIHYLTPYGMPPELLVDVLPESGPWTVLWTPTENGDTEWATCGT